MYVIAHNGGGVYGGTEKATALILAGLQERGHRVLYLCKGEVVAGPAEALGVPTRIVRIGGDLDLPSAWRFGRVLREEAPDALLLTTFSKTWLGGLGARLARVPRTVMRIGISGDLPKRLKYQIAMRHLIDQVVVNAEGMRRPFLEQLPGLDPSRVLTIHDGVRAPERLGGAGEVRRALGIPPEAQVIGAVARLAYQKRFDRLLHALTTLPAHVHCILAGEGKERETLESLAATLGVRERVHFLGYRADVGDVLDALDLFVISSDQEGLSNAMLEAMAAGVPVVSTPVSGAAEALATPAYERAPGVIVGFEVGELAATLGELLAEPARLRAMGAAAAWRAHEHFGFERMLDLYEAVLGGAGVPAEAPAMAQFA